MNNFKNIFRRFCLACAILMALAITGCNDLYDEQLTHKPDKVESNPDCPPSSDYTLELIVDHDMKWGKVRAYKDLTFDSLFTRDLGWNGGDGVYSTLLPDGNTFWSFGDSFFGKLLDSKMRKRGGDESNFPRNAAMIQTSMKHDELMFLNELVQTNDPSLNTYYKGKTFLRHPAAILTQKQIDAGEVDADKFYWSGDATVYKDNPGGPILQVIWGAMRPLAAPASGTERFATAYSSYKLEGTLGDPSYMKLVEFIEDFRPMTTNYGSTMWEDEDGHIYLYGSIDMCPVVARTETYDLKSEWEYYIRKEKNGQLAWQKDVPTTDQIKLSTINDAQWASQPTILKVANTYYMVAQEAVFGREIFVWRADNPWGPYKDKKIIFYLPDEVSKIGVKKYGHAYNSFVHPQFSRQGELLLSINVDAPDFWHNFGENGSADFYRPYFFRLFNWLSVYDVN